MSLSDRFPTVVICEDVREEINHKRILIGVFSGDILVSSLPGQLSLTLYIEHKLQGEQKLEFIIYYAEEEQARIEMQAETKEVGVIAVIPFPRFGLAIKKPGELRVDVSIDSGEPEKLIAKTVGVGEIPSSFGPATLKRQPS